MRLSGFRLPLEHLSASSLSTFSTCPEQFRRKYLLNIKESMSGDRFMGIVQHKALAMLFDQDYVKAEPRKAVTDAWETTIDSEGEPEWHDEDATEAFRRAGQMMDAYWPIATSMEVLANEQRFEERIAGVELVGYIDREVREGSDPRKILEVKTAKAKVSKPKPRWTLQGRLYSLVSNEPIEWHVVTRQATPKVYTHHDDERLLVPRFNHDVTVRLIEHSVQRMNDLYARHGSEEPWPMDGTSHDWACDYCSYKGGCFAWSS